MKIERVDPVEFKNALEKRTKEFAVAVFRYLDALPKKSPTQVIAYQFGKFPLEVSDGLSRKLSNMSVVASVMVVVLHVGIPVVAGSSGWWLYHFLEQICKIAVPFFFLASGFFLVGHADRAGWWQVALRKRVRTLAVPYFIWSVLWCVWFVPICCRRGGWTSFVQGKALDFLGLDLLHPPFYSVAWYLRALLFFVLLSPILVMLVRRLGWWFVGFLYLLDFAFRFNAHVEGEWLRGFFSHVFSLEGAAYFVLGMGLRLGFVKPITIPRKGWLLALSIILLLVITVLYARGVFLWMSLEGLLIPLVMMSIWSCVPERPWLKVLTGNAFALYMIHGFILSALTASAMFPLDSAIFLVLKILLTIPLSIFGIVVIRRLFPLFAATAFGGR